MASHSFLFPGQGSQYLGMAGELVSRSKAAYELFSQANSLLGYDLLNICLKGPDRLLNSTEFSQPAIFVSSLAALTDLALSRPELVENCYATAGLSLGEYTALVFAGAISFEDGLSLVRQRGIFMQSASNINPGSMASILLISQEKLELICLEVSKFDEVIISNFLCPGNLVISGTKKAVEQAQLLASDAGAKVIKLSVAGAFHTEFMESARRELSEILHTIPIQDPKIPVWSNVTGKPHGEIGSIRKSLELQVVKPVYWHAIMLDILDKGCLDFYEIGPGKVLTGLLKRINRKASCFNIPA